MNKPPLLLMLLATLAGGTFIALQQPANGQAPAAAIIAAPAPEPWAHEASDLKPDPKVRFGQLENGMKYAILPNSEPPGRIALRLHVDAGSLMEADDQQGVAHFLEHMVFNGTKSFPDSSTLIPQMQRLGIAFGAHANAYTSFDETVYMLDLPNMAPDTLDLAFTVMRDFADGALLASEEIDKERGVILSEKRSRDTVDQRLMKQQFETIMPDSLITDRFPIGTEAVISTAPRKRFVDFYSDYYRPDNITFIASGDFEADAIEKRIKDSFASATNPEKSGPEPDLGKLPTGKGLQLAVFTDKEVKSDEVSILALRPYTPELDTAANRVKRLPLSLAHSIIDRRFEILSKKEGSPISSGNTGRFAWFDAIEFGSASVTPVEGEWKNAVPVLEQEFRRALEHGFTQSELDEITARLLNAYEQAVKAAPTRKSNGRGGLASQLAQSINGKDVFTTPEEDLRIVADGLKVITPEDCHKALREFWDTEDFTLVLTTREAPGDADQTLRKLFTSSKDTAVDPPVAKEDKPFAYSSFGEPGTVVSDTTVKDLGIRQLVLSNGIRINLKTTDFQKNRISIMARFGSGTLGQPADKTGLDGFAGMVMNLGGLGEHSADELERLLAGRNVSSGFGIGEDSFYLAGSTTPDDLELQLQVMTAGLTDPGYREEAVRQYRQMIPQIFAGIRHTLRGSMKSVQAWLRGGDGRFAVPEEAVLGGYEVADVKAWLQDSMAKDYLEISLVGDLDADAALPLILKTFGALPKRADKKTIDPALRKLAYPETPAEKGFSYESKIPNAAALIAWKIPSMANNVAETRRLNIVANILDDRMRKKIREELGASYSPSANASASDAFDFGVLNAFSQGKPEDSEKVGKLIIEIGQKLAADGATQDELDRSLKPVLAQLETSLRDNSYWLNTVMAQSQHQPHRLDWARQRDKDYGSITVEDINSLAKKYLVRENALRIELQPVEPVTLP